MTAITRPAVFRQSLLAGFEKCPRRTMRALTVGDDLAVGWVEASGALGSAFHAVMAEILRTLYRQGEEQISTQEAVEVMYEVLAAGSFVLPAQEREDLKWLVVGSCEFKWKPRRIMAVEETLTLDLAGPDGELRTLKGQPDVLLADPPKGLVIVDFKTGRAMPRSPRQAPEDGAVIEGKQYLSDRGHFQLDCYGLLALRAYPAAEYVTLRELHLRSGETREATLRREDLEHVERELGLQMMLVDRGIAEGEDSDLWRPRPGKHCATQCPVARSCPIPMEMRGDGAIEDEDVADEVAALATVAQAQASQSVKQLKAWQEAGNRPGRANEGEEMRWGPEPDAWKAKGGGRKFGLWPRIESEGSSDE